MFILNICKSSSYLIHYFDAFIVVNRNSVLTREYCTWPTWPNLKTRSKQPDIYKSRLGPSMRPSRCTTRCISGYFDELTKVYCYTSFLLLLSLWMKSLSYYLILLKLTVTWILSPLLSWNNARQSSFLQSPISSICLSQLAFSQISSRIVLFILISRSLVLIRKISQTIVPYLISLICLNSPKELSKLVSLNIYLITIS